MYSVELVKSCEQGKIVKKAEILISTGKNMSAR